MKIYKKMSYKNDNSLIIHKKSLSIFNLTKDIDISIDIKLILVLT